MNSPLNIILILFILNTLFFIVMLDYSLDSISPILLTNSSNSNIKDEIESLLLKSIQKYLFPTTINKNNQSLNRKNSFNIKPHNIIKIFLDEYKANIMILVISNEKDENKRYAEVSLYSTELLPYLSVSVRYNDININKCWSNTIPNARINLNSLSPNKSQLGIVYNIADGPNILTRIRYYTNIKCDNKAITADSISFSNAILNLKNNSTQSNQDISDTAYVQDIKLSNFSSDNSFDDFSLTGNSPLTAFSINNDLLAYSRYNDYYSSSILKRTKNENNTQWINIFNLSNRNKSEHIYSNINTLILSDDFQNEFLLYENYLEVSNDNRISLDYNIYTGNYTHDNYTYVDEDDMRSYSFKYNINNRIYNSFNNEEINSLSFENILEIIKDYTKPRLISNSNIDGMIFESFNGVIGFYKWANYINLNHIGKKDKGKLILLSSDENNENIIAVYYFYNHIRNINIRKIYIIFTNMKV